MTCCCSLAGTKACTYCTNNPYAEPERRYVLNVASTQPCIFKYEKPKTNADRIRSMTDEELASLLKNPCDFEPHVQTEWCRNRSCGYQCALDWLKKEAAD